MRRLSLDRESNLSYDLPPFGRLDGVQMRRTAYCLAIFGLTLVALDVFMAGLCRATGLPDRVTDIQQPATLVAKLDRLRAAPGPKIVLVGDSLVQGGSLEE